MASRQLKLDRDTRDFVQSRRVARLASVDVQSRPHVVPICFVLVGESIYSVIDQKPKRAAPERLRRLQNIALNAHVQVLFDHYDDDDWSRLRFAQLRGRARVLSSGAEYDWALSALRERYRQYKEMALTGRPIIAVDVDDVVVWPR